MGKSELQKLLEDSAKRAAFLKSSSFLNLDLPDGWVYLNKIYVENRYDNFDGKKLPKTDGDLLNFFNGTMPLEFKIALTSSVPRRDYVSDLLKKINDAAEKKQCSINLLLGEGGEGKSTILRQVAVDLVKQSSPKIHVLFCEHGKTPLETSIITRLMQHTSPDKKTNYTFVIICDKANIIADKLFDCVQTVKEMWYTPNKIQFLLASRGTQWEWSAPPDYKWKIEAGDFHKIPINQLSKQDAQNIVKAWEEAGAITGNLEKMNFEQRWSNLYDAAFDSVSGEANLNSFYSAIFDIRRGVTLSDYIKGILNEFKNKPSLKDKSLKDYFSYIIALHADGFPPMLTKPILCRALECTEQQLNDKILKPLAEGNAGEAQIVESKYILARHDVVAEQVKRFMEKEDSGLFPQIVGDLAAAAELDFRQRKLNGTINDSENEEWKQWDKLPKRYFEDLKQPEMGINIARVVAEKVYSESVFYGAWANLVATAGDKDKLRQASDIFDREQSNRPNFLDRGCYTDWGVIQGKLGNDCLDTWLTGIAMSDGIKESRENIVSFIRQIPSLATVFSRLYVKSVDSRNANFYNESNAAVFKQATEGVINFTNNEKFREKVGKDSDFTFPTSSLEKAHARIGKSEIPKRSLEVSFKAIVEGINLAWDLRGFDNGKLSDYLPDARNLTFNELGNAFGIKIDAKRKEIDSSAIVETAKAGELYIFRRLKSGSWEIGEQGKSKHLDHKGGYSYIYEILNRRDEEVPLEELHSKVTRGTTSNPHSWVTSYNERITSAFQDIQKYLGYEFEKFLRNSIHLRNANSDEPYIIYQPDKNINWILE